MGNKPLHPRSRSLPYAISVLKIHDWVNGISGVTGLALFEYYPKRNMGLRRKTLHWFRRARQKKWIEGIRADTHFLKGPKTMKKRDIFEEGINASIDNESFYRLTWDHNKDHTFKMFPGCWFRPVVGSGMWIHTGNTAHGSGH